MAGKGTFNGSPPACRVLVQGRLITKHGGYIETQSLDVCLFYMYSFETLGQIFDCLSIPKNAKVTATFNKIPFAPILSQAEQISLSS